VSDRRFDPEVRAPRRWRVVLPLVLVLALVDRGAEEAAGSGQAGIRG